MNPGGRLCWRSMAPCGGDRSGMPIAREGWDVREQGPPTRVVCALGYEQGSPNPTESGGLGLASEVRRLPSERDPVAGTRRLDAPAQASGAVSAP